MFRQQHTVPLIKMYMQGKNEEEKKFTSRQLPVLQFMRGNEMNSGDSAEA